MKITRVETFKFWVDWCNWLFVRIDTDEGLCGWGEGSLHGSIEAVETAIREMAPQLIGEDPAGVPNNLMPFVAQVASGRRPRLRIFGNDYPTVDGTGVRDYIHVVDVASGHVAALNELLSGSAPREMIVNLGTGRGHSVLELVQRFEVVSGRPVPYDIVDRRPGDVATCYADATRARTLLRWEARRGLDQMCADAWRWQAANPTGFRA